MQTISGMGSLRMTLPVRSIQPRALYFVIQPLHWWRYIQNPSILLQSRIFYRHWNQHHFDWIFSFGTSSVYYEWFLFFLWWRIKGGFTTNIYRFKHTSPVVDTRASWPNVWQLVYLTDMINFLSIICDRYIPVIYLSWEGVIVRKSLHTYIPIYHTYIPIYHTYLSYNTHIR